MPKHRKSPQYQEGHENLTDELVGKIVQFYYRTSTGYPYAVILRVVSLFTPIETQNIIIGDFIAGETDTGYLLKKRITGYRIVTKSIFSSTLHC